MAGTSAIRLDGLSRRYGDLEAVRGIDLEIAEGELFGLLGPNGAGKTTTLSMLSTLLRPSAGDALFFGKSLRDDPRAVRRLVGLVPQEVSVYPRLSGRANVEFFGRLYGLSGDDLTQRAGAALALVGLEGRGEDLADTYSGGMQRRLNLACGIVHRPRVLLLDEPTAGVDPQSRERLLEVVRDLARDGTTVVYTTHYMEEAERVCSRIAIMDQGEIIASGPLASLLRIVGTGEVIELSGATGPLGRERFASLPGLLDVDAVDGGLRLYVESVTRALGPLGALLAEVDGGPEHVEVYPIDLERVFMHLTGRALRD